MSSIKYNVWLPQKVALVVAVTALINVLLFAGLPWLTRVADREQDRKMVIPYLLTPRRAPKTPETEKEKRLRKEELKRVPKAKSKSSSTKRDLNMPKFGFEFGEVGFGDGMAVAMIDIDAGSFGLDMDKFGFDLSQVDKAPRVVRRVLPMYPFSAKRRGLRGWVKIRCLVGKDGLATGIVAVESKPADILDIFGPVCVEAVKKYRFRPGEIGGDPVPTRVAFRIIFELE